MGKKSKAKAGKGSKPAKKPSTTQFLSPEATSKLRALLEAIAAWKRDDSAAVVAAAELAARLNDLAADDNDDELMALRESANLLIQSNVVLPLLQILQGCAYSAVTLQPTGDVSPLQAASLEIAACLVTAADATLRQCGWEIIDDPDDLGRPAFLHRASSMLRNTPPELEPWPAPGPATWSRLLLLDLPTLLVPCAADPAAAAAAARAAALHAPNAIDESAAAGLARRQRRLRNQGGPNAASKTSHGSSTSAAAAHAAGPVRWAVYVVEHVPDSHSVLDVLVDGRVDVTYRQLVRHDLDGAWKHTDGLAAVEVLVEEEKVEAPRKSTAGKLDATSPSLVPAASAEPLSFTKTTMAALPLLALPAARRHAYAASMLRASTASATRGEATASLGGDAKFEFNGESNVGDGSDPFGGSFQAAFDAENAAADAEADALDVDLEGVDGAGVDELVAEMLKGMAFEAQDFEASAAHFSSSTSNEDKISSGADGSSGAHPGMRVLVVGLSNGCDLARFAMKLGSNRVDGVDALGPGLAVARLRHVEQHLGLDLSSMAYVSLDQPSLLSGLQALEADGEAPPSWTISKVSAAAAAAADDDGLNDDACPQLVSVTRSSASGLSRGAGDWLNDNSSSLLYDAIVVDWAAESGSGTGPAAVTDELTNLIGLVAPWLSPTGLLCLGMGAGFASGGQYSSNAGASSGTKAASALQKACAACRLSGFVVVSDASSREEPHLAEAVVVASRATLRLPDQAMSPATVATTATASEEVEAVEVELTADAWLDAFGPGSSGADGFRLPMTLQEAELDEANAVSPGSSCSSGSNVPRLWAFWAEAEEAELEDKVAAAKPGEGIAANVWNEAFGSDDSDDDSDDDGGGKGSDEPPTDDEVSRRDAWASVIPPKLRAACPAVPLLRACQAALSPGVGEHAQVRLSTKETSSSLPSVHFPALVAKPGALQAQLDSRGYAVCSSDVSTGDPATAASAAAEEKEFSTSLRHDEPALLSFVHGAVLALKRKQLAPAHVYLYDATWELALRVWPLAEAVLGKDCVLEPSFAAFALDPQKAGTSYVGTNFGRPHRDYSYADSLEPNADDESSPASSQRLKVLSVWVPLNYVNTSNGCMYVVPRPCDTGFADPLGAEGLQSPRVPTETVGGVVPLAPHPPGTFMCWTGNTVHWGSACAREGAADPRASLAFVFRRAGARLSQTEISLTRSDVAAADTASRLQWVHKAIGFFKHWYPDASLDYKGLPWASKGEAPSSIERGASKKRVVFS